MKSYLLLQNASFAAINVSQFLRVHQEGGNTPPTPKIRVYVDKCTWNSGFQWDHNYTLELIALACRKSSVQEIETSRDYNKKKTNVMQLLPTKSTLLTCFEIIAIDTDAK